MSRPLQTLPEPTDERAAVLTRAVLAVSGRLALSQRELGAVLGLSEASMSRVVQGRRLLAGNDKQWELAALLVRLYRALDTLVGGSDDKARAWFRAGNTHLGAAPAERVRTVEGLVGVVNYLDAMRGKL